MIAGPVSGRGSRRRGFAPALLLLLTGCVTTYEKVDYADEEKVAELAVPVAIPFDEADGRESRLLLEFYGSILRRLEEAAADGDVALIDSLVDTYDTARAPESVRQKLRGYRTVARGIGFARHASQNARLRLRGGETDGELPTPPLGEPLRLVLTLPAMAQAITLGGEGDATSAGFLVSIQIDDEFADGGSSDSSRRRLVRLPRPIELRGDTELELPFDVDVDPGLAVRRSVVARVDLMPGHVRVGEVLAPVRRTAIAADTWEQYPAGYEELVKQPLVSLRAALADFGPKQFARAYLAAKLVPEPQRDEVCELLIDQVRFGRQGQAQVAMAALQQVTGVDVAVGDRDGWLAWWQARRR